MAETDSQLVARQTLEIIAHRGDKPPATVKTPDPNKTDVQNLADQAAEIAALHKAKATK